MLQMPNTRLFWSQRPLSILGCKWPIREANWGCKRCHVSWVVSEVKGSLTARVLKLRRKAHHTGENVGK